MIDRKKLYKWCAVSAEELKKSKDLKVRLRVVKDSAEMGEIIWWRRSKRRIVKTENAGRSYRAGLNRGTSRLRA